ncbi:MAG: DUF1963 domain-containing protein [Clostridium sp.]|nr:DUF1963 domain-containing protein [Clostridium sp.]
MDNKILNEVINLTTKKAIFFKAVKKKTNIFNSKLGGTPYIPKDFCYPLDNDEEFKKQPLRFLAQINFEELPKLEGFPCKGILQFYIACNSSETLGSNLQSPNKGESFRVVYHENIDYSLKEDKDVLKLEFKGSFPFYDEYKLIGRIDESIINFNDFKFNEIFLKTYKKFKDTNAESYYDIESISVEKIEETFRNNDIYLGGNPNLLQGDIRYREEFSDYDMNLFTVSSDNKVGINIGDEGIINFLIRKKDLNKLDFSNVLYYLESY